MISRLLVPLDLSEHSAAATASACGIASHQNASITGLTVIDTEGILDATALPFHAELLDYPQPAALAMAKNAAAKLETARSEFCETCEKNQVQAEVRRLSGRPSDGILDLARFHDLLVIGLRTHFHFETEEKPGDTLSEVLDQTPIPTLLVPAAEPDPFRRAIIAFDGSPSATRAMHAFADFWPVSRPKVRIIVSVHDRESGGHLLDEAQKFLQARGITDVTTDLAEEPLQEAFEERHLEWADLIVAGVRSQPPLKRLFVGSFTRYLVDRGHRALLLCQ